MLNLSTQFVRNIILYVNIYKRGNGKNSQVVILKYREFALLEIIDRNISFTYTAANK